MLHVWRARRTEQAEDGFTLVELLVSMIILGVFFSVFTGIVVKVFETTRRQADRSTSVDASRNIVQVLDRQIRYANGIYEPKTATNGIQYVVWSARDRTGVDTCYQWQATPAGVVRWISWPKGSTDAVTFRTAGTGIRPRTATPIFSLVDAGGTIQVRQRLTMNFQSGTGKDGSPTRVAFTALNTTSDAVPTTPVCQERNP